MTSSTISTLASAERPRRTQAQRTAQTRAKLLDATIECLAEHGYAATTNGALARRAGVSRGAQTHHFPRRIDPIVSAVEEIAARRIEQWSQEIEALPSGPGRLGRALDVGRAPQPAVDRDDEAVDRRRRRPRAARADGGQRARARARLSRARAQAARRHGRRRRPARPRLNVALNAMRGLALVQAFEPVEHERADPWPGHRRVLEALLAS